MKALQITYYYFLIISLFTLSSCRKNQDPAPEEDFQFAQGLYLLNEGNMSMNKASLDFYDYASGSYERNVFNRANPSIVLGLGDVGNDLKIYGSKIYMAINASNKVEVVDAHSVKRIKKIDLINVRNITCYGGKVYVSSYDTDINLGNPSPNGKVLEIDTASLEITRTVLVGRQPNGLAVAQGKLYVANSGGYDPSAYECSLSVIDLGSFTEIKRIEVGINLNKVEADKLGNIWVTSLGDYDNIPENLFVIDPKTDQLIHTFNLPISNFWLDSEQVYTYSGTYYQRFPLTQWDQPEKLLSDELAQRIQLPYGIAVDPQNKHFFITDAKNYVTPGTLYEFDSKGNLIHSWETGDIPAHMDFLR